MTELNILHIIQNFNFVTVMSNIKNNSLNYLMSYPSTNTVLTFVGPSVGLISSICCLTILNSHLKKLHPTFKTLMNIILVHNVVSLVASIGLSTFMLMFEYQTFLVCSIYQVTISSSAYLVRYGIALMSFMRYHIAWKISQTESTKKSHRYMIGLLILYLVFDYFSLGPMSFFIALYFQIPSGATNCAGVIYHGPSVLPIFHIIKVLVIIVIGIRYDFLMMDFLKKRNSKNGPGQARLVPWKSGKQEMDLLVPVSATVCSVIIGIVDLVLFTVYVKKFDDNEAWKSISFGLSLISSLEMPIMIALTIRAAKHHKPAPVLPKGPMFHEPEIELTSQADNVQASNQEGVQEPTLPNIINVRPVNETV